MLGMVLARKYQRLPFKSIRFYRSLLTNRLTVWAYRQLLSMANYGVASPDGGYNWLTYFPANAAFDMEQYKSNPTVQSDD